MHSYERLQQKAMELEKKIKSEFPTNKPLALQLIAGAKEAVDYSYQRDRNEQWYVRYIGELENRL